MSPQASAPRRAPAPQRRSDPVLPDGEAFEQETDLRFPGNGLAYEFTRTYRSGVDFRGPLGYGWDHNYNRRLVRQCDGSITYHDGALNVIQFWPGPARIAGPTIYVAEPGVHLVLEARSDGYAIIEPSGVTSVFDLGGVLQSIQDLAGNKLTFGYTKGALTSVKDTTGRFIEYDYWTADYDFLRCIRIAGEPTCLVSFQIDVNWHNESYAELSAVTNAVGKGPQYVYYHPLKHETPFIGDAELDPSCKAMCSGNGLCDGQSVCATTAANCDKWQSDIDGCTNACEKWMGISAFALCHSQCQSGYYKNWCLQKRAEWYPFCTASDCYSSCVATFQTPETHSGPRDFAYGRITDLNHNLTAIYDGEGRLRLSNTYGDNVFDVSFDKVVTQTWGDRTIQFDYHDLVQEAKGKTIAIGVHPTSGLLSSVTAAIKPQVLRTPISLPPGTLPVPIGVSGPIASLPPGTITIPTTPPVTPRSTFVATNVCPNHCVSTGANGQCAVWAYDAATTAQVPPSFAVSLKDVRGVWHTSYYDDNWLLLRDVNDSNGEITDYSYDANQNLDGVGLPSGQRLCIESDALGRPLQVTSVPAANLPGSAAPIVSTYGYDTAGQLTDVYEDPQGQAAHLHIDRDQLERPHYVTRSVGGGQAVATTINYGVGLYLANVEAPGGAITNYVNYDNSGGGPQSIIIDATGPSPITYSYTYNSLGEVTSRGEVNAAGQRFAYDAAGQLYQIDRFVDPTSAVDSTIFTLDGNGNPKHVDATKLTQDITYSLVGDVAKIAEGLKNTAPTLDLRNRCYAYYPDGLAQAEVHGEGDRTTYSYDASDRLVSIVRGYSTDALPVDCPTVTPTNAGSPEEVAHFTYQNGLLTGAVIDGVSYAITSDGLGRTIEIKDPTGRLRRRGYDFRSRLIWESVYAPNPSTKPYGYPSMGEPGLAAMTEYHYDDLNRIIELDRWRVETAEIDRTNVNYDDGKRTVTTTHAGGSLVQTYDGAGRLVSEQYPNGATITTTFAGHVATRKTPTPGGVVTEIITLDGLGLPATIKDGDGTVLYTAEHDVDGHTVHSLRLGQLDHLSTYDGYGRLVADSQLANATTTLSTLLVYDHDDRLLLLKDPEGSQTQFAYDGLGRITSKTDALNRTTLIQYVAGTARPSTQHDPSGMSWTFAYDDAGRLQSETAKAVPWLTGYVTQRQFGYDALDDLTLAQQFAPNGTLTSSVSLGYDSLGELTSDSSSHTSLAVQHTYSIDGLTKTTTVGSSTVKHVFDQLGRIQNVTLNGAPLATYTYQPATLGGPQKVEYANGSHSIFGYDLRGRQIGVVVESVLNGTTVSDAFVKDTPNGDETVWTRQRWTRGAQVENDQFTFDGAGRLAQESKQVGTASATVRSYTLDGVADWKTSSISGAASSANSFNALHQLTSLGAQYDLDGNLNAITPAGQEEQYGYDAFDQLTSATVGTTSATYGYDALGRRVSESSGGKTQYLVWDGADLIAQDFGQGQTLEIAGQDVNDHLASVAALGAGSRVFHHQAPDQSNLAVTGDAGFIEGYSYTAFGETSILGPDGSARAASSVGNRFLFQGQLFDALTQTYSMRAREYHPRTGRFLSQDPLGLVGGLNEYAFADGNPVFFTDAFGLTKRKPHVPYPTTVVGREDPSTPAMSGMPPRPSNPRFGDSVTQYSPTAADTYSRARVYDDWDVTEGALRGRNGIDALKALADRTASRAERALNHSRWWSERAGEVVENTIGLAGVIGGLKGHGATQEEGAPPPNLSPEGAGRSGAFAEAKRQSGIPVSQQPSRVLPNLDRRGQIQPGRVYEFELPAEGGGTRTVQIRDDAGGHYFGPENPQNRGPHFNDESGNHYDY